ncbi:MAG: phenylacetic acid degradation protein PaaD [Rhizobiales bacterium 24-66-13]|jgi:acyl-CoA thioesterase|nr:MAG: phenylacetic acid degradation protein PaaD [Rhizobiales bacterium 24-66-13]OZB11689.1 MAG: phenylacetic acid degradation protein PaaD [Rhizobiales bacterium 39-66-18]HQS09585.1 hydroxyphenylacetyl-CoA thioesterase PaaI [Xanthobacteraceae bacterium]HQS44851.1 hydroxyphenylacetyl-CoA thioesterase PaaI [Xanthobacteraceae bacterium]
MWTTDLASQGLGMEILAVGPGTATLAMTLTERMCNGFGMGHGGFIFALADSAFAFACNSYDERTVAQHCSITYLRPGTRGKRLVAQAREVARSGRSGIYDIEVTQDGVAIAQFRGHSRTIGGALIAPAASGPESRNEKTGAASTETT